MYNSTIARLTSVEFFAAMPPGLYVCLVAFVSFSSCQKGYNCSSLWEQLLELADILQKNPMLILFGLFAAFICGSIIRSIPAKWAECLTSFGIPPFFPYKSVLEKMLANLENEEKASLIDKARLPDLSEMSGTSFNYWKDALCVQAPDAFIYYQTYEARSRFYTGMFWAGAAGDLGSVFMAYSAYQHESAMFSSSLQLFALSTALIIAFGLQIRHVREQETRLLLTLFIALTQQNQQAES
jgi:hypothetical protein